MFRAGELFRGGAGEYFGTNRKKVKGGREDHTLHPTVLARRKYVLSLRSDPIVMTVTRHIRNMGKGLHRRATLEIDERRYSSHNNRSRFCYPLRNKEQGLVHVRQLATIRRLCTIHTDSESFCIHRHYIFGLSSRRVKVANAVSHPAIVTIRRFVIHPIWGSFVDRLFQPEVLHA